jgi:hypothetical protein
MTGGIRSAGPPMVGGTPTVCHSLGRGSANALRRPETDDHNADLGGELGLDDDVIGEWE